MTRRRSKPHALIGAYALNAADGAASGQLERHAAHCQECADELAGLRETAARLGTAAAVRPPAALRQRVLAASERTAQLPPLTGRSRSWGDARRKVAVAAGSLAAAAAVVVATVLPTRPGGEPGRGHVAGRRADIEIAAVLTAPDAKMIDARVRIAGHATVIMSAREDALVFTAAGLPGLSPGRRYELWLIGPHRDRPAGMLPPPRHGMTGPVVSSGLRRGDRLGLTVEPSRGASRPTSAMLLLVPL